MGDSSLCPLVERRPPRSTARAKIFSAPQMIQFPGRMRVAQVKRCSWVSDDPLYTAYHDDEWGVPERDPRALFEKLMLDGFQAGLSWITILRKREAFRAAF